MEIKDFVPTGLANELAEKIAARQFKSIGKEELEDFVKTRIEIEEKNNQLDSYFLILMFEALYKKGFDKVSFENRKLTSEWNLWVSQSRRLNTIVQKVFHEEFETVKEECEVFRRTFDQIFIPFDPDQKVFLLNLLIDVSTNKSNILIEAEEYRKQEIDKLEKEALSKIFWMLREEIMNSLQKGDSIYGALNQVITKFGILAPEKV